MPWFLGSFQPCDLPALALFRLLGWAVQGVRADGALTTDVTYAIINSFSPFGCFMSLKLVAQTPAAFESEDVAALAHFVAS